MRVAIVQVSSTDDLDTNLANAERGIQEAAERGVVSHAIQSVCVIAARQTATAERKVNLGASKGRIAGRRRIEA